MIQEAAGNLLRLKKWKQWLTQILIADLRTNALLRDYAQKFENTKIGPVLDVKVAKVCLHQNRHETKNHDRISVSRRDSFLGSNRERN